MLESSWLNSVDSECQVIKAWSASRLDVYETCPKRAEFQYVQRIPEPDRGPPPKGMKEWANDRGSRVHEHCEHYVFGRVDKQIAEMKAFESEFTRMRELAQDGHVLAEDMWAFDRNWASCDVKDFANIWARVIIDAVVFDPQSPEIATVIDYKTGKRVFNEIKHAKQVQLYQLASFLRYPQLQHVTTELWYLDQNEMFQQKFTRSQGLKFLKGFNERGIAMTTATRFPPKPNMHNCRFCPYKSGMIGKNGPMGTGHCDLNPI
jgi:hypothetical protein